MGGRGTWLLCVSEGKGKENGDKKRIKETPAVCCSWKTEPKGNQRTVKMFSCRASMLSFFRVYAKERKKSSVHEIVMCKNIVSVLRCLNMYVTVMNFAVFVYSFIPAYYNSQTYIFLLVLR